MSREYLPNHAGGCSCIVCTRQEGAEVFAKRLEETSKVEERVIALSELCAEYRELLLPLTKRPRGQGNLSKKDAELMESSFRDGARAMFERLRGK